METEEGEDEVDVEEVIDDEVEVVVIVDDEDELLVEEDVEVDELVDTFCTVVGTDAVTRMNVEVGV